MLQDLLRATPVSDCPTSHDEIGQILDHTRFLVGRINMATGNPVYRDRISKTMLLQEKVDISKSVRKFWYPKLESSVLTNSRCMHFAVYT
jgi:hypothetical protein